MKKPSMELKQKSIFGQSAKADQVSKKAEKPQAQKPIAIDRLQIWIDGASRGNPGPSGVGIVFKAREIPTIEKGFFIGRTTNNVAEYFALLSALVQIKQLKELAGVTQIEVLSDSSLMVNQVNGLFKTKNSKLFFLKELILSKLMNYKWTLEHTPREKNTQADRMSNVGIDKNVPLPETLGSIFAQIMEMD